MKHYTDIESWLAEGDRLASQQEDVRTGIAEWAADGRRQFGEDAEQGFTKFSEFTVTNYLSAMKRTPDSVVPPATKRRIGITARQAVAALNAYPDVQRQLLAQYSAGTPREQIREAVASFLETVNATPETDDADTDEDDEFNAGVSEPTWMDYEALEVASGDIGGLWSRVMKLLVAIKGQRVRLVIQVAAVQRTVDQTTGEITDVG